MSDKKPVKIIIHGYPEELITVNDELICIKTEEKAYGITLTMTLKSLWLAKNRIHNKESVGCGAGLDGTHYCGENAGGFIYLCDKCRGDEKC